LAPQRSVLRMERRLLPGASRPVMVHLRRICVGDGQRAQHTTNGAILRRAGALSRKNPQPFRASAPHSVSASVSRMTPPPGRCFERQVRLVDRVEPAQEVRQGEATARLSRLKRPKRVHRAKLSPPSHRPARPPPPGAGARATETPDTSGAGQSARPGDRSSAQRASRRLRMVAADHAEDRWAPSRLPARARSACNAPATSRPSRALVRSKMPASANC